MRAQELNDRIRKAYDTISLVNQNAYNDLYLISNHVLGKNPYNNDFLNRALSSEEPEVRPWHAIIFTIAAYYVKSISYFAIYLFNFIEFLISGVRFRPCREKKELVLVDIFFNMDEIRKSGKFRDTYFPKMEEIFKKKGVHYAYLPFFSSPAFHKKPLELFTALNVLKKDQIPVIAEFQLLSLTDIVSIFFFIVMYPFHVLGLARRIGRDTREKNILKSELIDSMGQATFYNFSRYLQGRRLAALPYQKIKLVSWYENQPIHKNLYKGLRTDASKVRIYGAQLFLYSRYCLSIVPDESETRFGVVPDKIIANGPYYVPDTTSLEYEVGPSMRYEKIFHTAVKGDKRTNILVLLPYMADVAESILRMISKAKMPFENLLIKFHLALPVARFRKLIPPAAAIVKDDIYRLFEEAKIVISASSGTLVEAASLGIFAISVKSAKRIDYSNPLPEYGRGMLWEEVESPEGLVSQIEKFDRILIERPDEVSDIAARYKGMFFSEVSEEKICKAFDL